MKKVFFLLISVAILFSDTISFKELTALASNDLGKNIYLDKDIKDYTVDISLSDYQKSGQIYEFYKIVLFDHDLILQFNKRGDFYYVKEKKVKFSEPKVLPPLPIKSPQDRVHFYTYKVKNITNQDVIDCMSIFTGVKYKYLKQSDIIAYAATFSDHLQIRKILKRADNKVLSRSIKITIFSVDKNRLKDVGSVINKLGFSVQSEGGIISSIADNLSRTFVFQSGFESDMFISYLERFDITRVNHSPKILLSNGVEATLESVTNVRYLTGTAQVDNQNNNTVRENYEFRDVGLKIKLLPKIKDNWVYLDLALTSEEIISFEKDNPTVGKILYHNSFKIVKGKPLLLTGINKTIRKTRKSGVPILRDLPVLKHIFGGKSNSDLDSNINILIEVL